MLSALSIRNIVLIEKLDLSFTPGLNVFTGETGAGKSIVLDSLALALGARGDAGLVRTGCKEGTVTAQFDIVYGHPIQNILSAHGIDSRDGVVLRRVQNADGRTRATINDTPVTAALLRQTSAALVEIHGQHDDRALVEPSSHRELLDVYAGVLEDKRVVAAKWTDWRTLQEQAREAEEALAQARRDADYTRAACEELSALAPLPGEEEALAVRRQQILAAQKVRAGLDEALQQLTGTNFPSAGLSSALRRLERQCACISA
jgi:DNA repair protein RecN (Recombination protein N)